MNDNNQSRKDHKSNPENWMTVNEIRAQNNLPPIEGGDVIASNHQHGFSWLSVRRFFTLALFGMIAFALAAFLINQFFPAPSNSGLDIVPVLIRMYIAIAVGVLSFLIPRVYYGRRHLQETWGQAIGYGFLYLISAYLLYNVLISLIMLLLH